MPANQNARGRAVTVKNHLQAVLVAASLGLAAAALREVPDIGMIPSPQQWWLLLASFGCALAAMLGLSLAEPERTGAARPVAAQRFWLGMLVATAGAALWVTATRDLYLDWKGAFDRTWLSWVFATCLLAVGLDLAGGVWTAAAWQTRWRWVWGAVAVTLLLGGAVRLGMIHYFPGPAGITQIEDLQFGNWGANYLAGDRGRWEFIGHAWVSALSIAVGGSQLLAMRVGYAVVGTLTVAAVFLWLRLAAGGVAAVVGTAFLIVSSWDAVTSRIGFNPNVLTITVLFVLLVGPARRGRPSAYAFMGLLSGYLLWEYIAYRPAAFFALLGGAYFSLRDRPAGWALRLGRPLLMVTLIVMMGVPLFGNRLKGRIGDEYLNPINRARATKQYYSEDYDLRTVVNLRVQRTLDTVGLLYFLGDASPARNLGRRPLVDPVSATLMMVGFAYCLANPAVQLFGLFGVAFLVTTIGAMIITGELNALRFSVAIPYLYFFVGLAGAAIYRLWGRAWGRLGRAMAMVVLALGFAWAAYSNLDFLHRYWTSESVHRAARSNLAFVANWLGRNVRPGEQVIGAAGRSSEALGPSDAAWLRGAPVAGVMEWDIMTALRRWTKGGPTVLFLFAGEDTRDSMKVLSHVIPGLPLEYVPDVMAAGGDVAFARLEDRPASLDAALESMLCNGVRVEYVYRGEGENEILHRLDRVEPVVGLGTWPTEVVQLFHRGLRPQRLEVRYDAALRIENAGRYRIEPKFYVGPVTVRIDGRQVPHDGYVDLTAGEHEFRAVADLAPLAGGLTARLLWSGPDSGGELELIPFYRIAEPLPRCPAPAQPTVGNS